MNLFPLALAFAFLCPNAQAKEQKKPKDKHLPKRYVQAGFHEARFTCEVPAKWKKIRSGLHDPEADAYGIILLGPKDKDGLSPSISVYYYTPDNADYEDADDFLAAYRNTAMWTKKGQAAGKPRNVLLAGRPARSLRRDAYEYAPRTSVDSRDIQKREDFVALPHGDGFFALTYPATISEHERWRPVFDRVLETFRPAALKERTEPAAAPAR